LDTRAHYCAYLLGHILTASMNVRQEMEWLTMTNLEVFQGYNQALIEGDFPRAMDFFAEDVVWHQPGTNIFSGTITGKLALGEHLWKFAAESQGTFRVLTNWVSVNREFVAANVTFQAEKTAENQLDLNGIDLFRIVDEEIKEVWLFTSEQTTEDNFWGITHE